ncbi:YlxQ-related RNA-binding protein [Aerococcus kribbianus]|uniref:YlxQ-related RNA-binding protein n=1 Tax=Aerococcus kribbianus TaxID=2999064 RepID=A0A9X3FLL4_9LACT|nr:MULTISPECIES: YlxQ-related RNA-binding protein [unclassified Aerococcus]MCZ0716772.1 YlxQ-related RNA-binding protein [Aerococcus sp. YH-aer221]MCZ0725060.1 YlxQ-related RNA-binding protein [Aerococcus sp. YH-aer222]
MNPKLNSLGLAQVAGKLVSGEALVIKAIQRQEAKLVFLANDCSPTTKKKIKNKSSYYDVPLVEEYTTMEISQALGKKRSLVALTDQGFAKRFIH